MNQSSAAISFAELQNKVRESVKPVRHRPGQYTGGIWSFGLHQLIYSVVENSISEIQRGYCDHIAVTIGSNRVVTIADNGSGIPLEIDPKLGISMLESVLTPFGMINGSRSGFTRHRVVGGAQATSIAAVNALSRWMIVTVQRDGNHVRQEYVNGVPETPITLVGPSSAHGTSITFLPDFDIFVPDFDIAACDYQYEVLDERFREFAYLNPTVRFTFRDERPGRFQEHEYAFSDGLKAFVRYLNRYRGRPTLDAIAVGGELNDGVFDAAIQYSADAGDSGTFVVSFANNAPTYSGGVHVAGFRSALTYAVNQFGIGAGMLRNDEQGIAEENVWKGLAAVISVKLDHPQFELATHTRLGGDQVYHEVRQLAENSLAQYFTAHPELASAIVRRCLDDIE